MTNDFRNYVECTKGKLKKLKGHVQIKVKTFVKFRTDICACYQLLHLIDPIIRFFHQ